MLAPARRTRASLLPSARLLAAFPCPSAGVVASVDQRSGAYRTAHKLYHAEVAPWPRTVPQRASLGQRNRPGQRRRHRVPSPSAGIDSCAAPTVAAVEVLTALDACSPDTKPLERLWSLTIRAATSASRAVASIRSGCPGSHGAPTVISQPPA